MSKLQQALTKFATEEKVEVTKDAPITTENKKEDALVKKLEDMDGYTAFQEALRRKKAEVDAAGRKWSRKDVIGLKDPRVKEAKLSKALTKFAMEEKMEANKTIPAEIKNRSPEPVAPAKPKEETLEAGETSKVIKAETPKAKTKKKELVVNENSPESQIAKQASLLLASVKQASLKNSK